MENEVKARKNDKGRGKTSNGFERKKLMKVERKEKRKKGTENGGGK